MNSTASQRRDQILGQSWPKGDLETAGLCPVCQSGRREKLHDGLWDNTAFVAPGSWSLWECSQCRSAYLDPRPTRDSIGRAYERYYTHDDDCLAETSGAVPRDASFRVRLANGYRNWRFGTNTQPSSRVGRIVGALAPAIRRSSDWKYRYLPLGNVAAPKVLDLGCGSGRWLSAAEETRWKVYGSDPDSKAVAQAQARGLTVRQGGLEAWSDVADYFDAITISHVIEHVHDPRELLLGTMRLLKPGGRLYVETPNIASLGHRQFGRAWRGLEPPRHLVLFNARSLTRLMREVGFDHVRKQKGPSQMDFIAAVSEELERLEDSVLSRRAKSQLAKWWLRTRSKCSGAHSEFLMVTGEKIR
jgi:2-polyprenyl-3-methyl-5-hydroxy-6-metoxy-1,4-benzoquinol methylase